MFFGGFGNHFTSPIDYFPRPIVRADGGSAWIKPVRSKPRKLKKYKRKDKRK